MTQRHNIRRGQAGFTLIELMVSVAILGIMAGIFSVIYLNASKLNQDHILFTRATAALSRQTEILKAASYDELKPGQGQPFSPDAASMVASLPGGTGIIDISSDDNLKGIKRINVQINWKNPWGATKSIHTVVMKAAP